MSQFRAKPIVVEAHHWQRNGDHPADYAVEDFADPMNELTYTGEYRKLQGWEGAVVRYFRHPEIAGWKHCADCGFTYQEHGWIDSGDEGRKVCPGDWIITCDGEHYPVKAALFAACYEPVGDLEEAGRVRA